MDNISCAEHTGLEVRDNPGHVQTGPVICYPYDHGLDFQTLNASHVLDVIYNNKQC